VCGPHCPLEEGDSAPRNRKRFSKTSLDYTNYVNEAS